MWLSCKYIQCTYQLALYCQMLAWIVFDREFGVEVEIARNQWSSQNLWSGAAPYRCLLDVFRCQLNSVLSHAWHDVLSASMANKLVICACCVMIFILLRLRDVRPVILGWRTRMGCHTCADVQGIPVSGLGVTKGRVSRSMNTPAGTSSFRAAILGSSSAM